MMRHNRYDTGHHTGFRAPHLTGNIITTLFSTANVNINLHPLWINFSLLFYTGNRPNLPQKPNEIYTLILQAIQAVTVRNITWQSYSPVYTDNTHTHTHAHTRTHTCTQQSGQYSTAASCFSRMIRGSWSHTCKEEEEVFCWVFTSVEQEELMFSEVYIRSFSFLSKKKNHFLVYDS